ncbi:MAB_1171c family putative transporter [Streptomyces goshikiensis]|uniref:MAB_1171c family putative transporter n=1 Tax=Streptomyces goshikiensis TaxID=1942 RepID=UPI0037A7B23A
MFTLYQFTLPALVWAMVLWRARSAWVSRPAACLWGFLVTAAVALTTRPTHVEQAVRTLTGLPDLSILLKHLTGVAAAYFLLEYVFAIHGRSSANQPGPRRLRVLFALTGAAALTLIFVFWFQHDPDAPASRVTDAHLGDTSVRAYEGVFYLYLGSATVMSARLFWTNRRGVPAGLLRVGVVLMAAGSAVGAVYIVYRVVFLAQQHSLPQSAGSGRFDLLSELLPVIGILLLLTGMTLPPLQTVVRYVKDQRALWLMYPMWSDLVTAVPTVAFGTAVSRTRDLFTIGDRTLDVAHRAFEIRDVSLALRDRTTATATASTEAPEPALPPGQRDPALAEAVWLYRACRAGDEGGHRLPAPTPPARSGGGTPAEEIVWLLKVAAHYRGLRDEPARGRTVPDEVPV